MLTPREQELYDLALASLPAWYSSETNPQVTVGAFAKIFGLVWDQIDAWVDIIYLKQAFGIWLDAHARDRGTRRQTGEGDDALLARLSVPPDALTKPALLAIAQAIVVGAGISGDVIMTESRVSPLIGGYWDPGAGAQRSFWGQGWRYQKLHDIAVILPIGTDDGTLAAVTEAMRLWAAGGVEVVVERTSSTSSYQSITITPPAAHATHGGSTVTFTWQGVQSDTVTIAVNGIAGGNSTVGTVTTGFAGSIVYHPPASIPSPVDVEVQAISGLDPSVVGRARVKIV